MEYVGSSLPCLVCGWGCWEERLLDLPVSLLKRFDMVVRKECVIRLEGTAGHCDGDAFYTADWYCARLARLHWSHLAHRHKRQVLR